MKDILIIGAGGVGSEVALLINQINEISKGYKLKGFIDDNEELWGQRINGIEVLGGLSFLEKLYEQIQDNMNTSFENLHIIIAISNYKVKKLIVEKLERKFPFVTLIHPQVYVDKSIIIGEGTIIYPGVIMTTNISIGNHVIISPKCGIGHDSIIKDYTSLLWNVNVSGKDIIEEGVLMGTGSSVIQEKAIGEGAVIGAGAIVIRDVPKYTTSVGVPAQVVG
ncbi:acetyltransferase [Clostridium tarantellae]|uniref:Transferase n=1 Tax=Clostridium tarantellae TaxID=39493 RepID=A0A6I1MMZ7_9CLOT|nr:acetyltransferase [Clostridium tarantellae]MPQ42291.1 transferase [Clostridium tarantellae]